MAIIPTPEKTSLAILDIFVNHFGCRPGDVLQRRIFNTLASEDFAPGLEFAVQQGWIEVLRGGSSFKLTAAGFAKA